MNSRSDNYATVQSVRRCLDLLEAVAAADTPAGVSALARDLALSKATTHRLCQTLLDRQFLEQDLRTRRYRLGWRLLKMASGLLGQFDMARSARPVLQKMADRHQHHAFAATLTGPCEMVVCEEVRVDAPVQPRSLLGLRFGLLDAPGGLLCLATLGPERLRAALKEGLRQADSGADRLAQEITNAVERLRGHTYSVQQAVPFRNLLAICSPVFDRHDEVTGVVGYCCPVLEGAPVDSDCLGAACHVAAREMSALISR